MALVNFWSPFPFVRIAIAFIAGIILAKYFFVSAIHLIYVSVAILVIFLLSGGLFRKHIVSTRVQGIFSVLSIVLLGFLYVNLTRTLPVEISRSVQGYKARIISEPEEKTRFYGMQIEIESLFTDKALIELSQKSHLYLRKSPHSPSLRYGDILMIRGRPERISDPSNPGEFNFASYWSNRNIFYQDFISSDQLMVLGNDPPNILIEYSLKLRDYCRQTLTEAISGEQERAIALALIIGVKDSIDHEVKEAYSAAGAMHVLAVSGLHVGILYLFILQIFRPLRHTKKGPVITGLVSIGVLWSYALVTGFSPSVQRAVVMFTIFIIGRMSQRPRNIYNSLALSALVLLLINPLMLYEVGFQLSYLAVLGIVFLHPRLYHLWSPDYWLVNKAWEISCLSMAAQVATFPLGLFYFHQFPLLFLIANLFVIPMAFIILIFGLLVLMLSTLGLELHQYAGIILESILGVMNGIVFTTESLDFSLLRGINLSLLQTILIYGALTALILLFVAKKFKYLIVATCLVLTVSATELVQVHARSVKKQAVLYDIHGYFVLDVTNGRESNLWGDIDVPANRLKFIVERNRQSSGVESDDITIKQFDQSTGAIPGIEFNILLGRKFLRISNENWLNVRLTDLIKSDYLIISNNSVESINELRSHISSSQVIIDSSNDLAQAEILKKEAMDLGINVHATGLDGALILDL